MSNITYTLKEACEKTQYKSSVIRYYEKEFNLNIPRDTNGRRFFTQKEIDKLLFIRHLQLEGYTNGQIKKILEDKKSNFLEEVSATNSLDTNIISNGVIMKSQDIKFLIEDKFSEMNSSLNELAQIINGKERDQIISENMKLKMEIKQKAYEIMELKEKLRYEKDKKIGIFNKMFKKTN